MKSTCPTCRSATARAGNKVYPFCSDRCQLIDLGRWLSEDYRIPAEPADPLVDGAGEDGGDQRS